MLYKHIGILPNPIYVIAQTIQGIRLIKGMIIFIQSRDRTLALLQGEGRKYSRNAAAGDILEFISTGALWLVDGKLNDTPLLATT